MRLQSGVGRRSERSCGRTLGMRARGNLRRWRRMQRGIHMVAKNVKDIDILGLNHLIRVKVMKWVWNMLWRLAIRYMATRWIDAWILPNDMNISHTLISSGHSSAQLIIWLFNQGFKREIFLKSPLSLSARLMTNIFWGFTSTGTETVHS